jgi:hypothetical protein
MTLEEGQEEQSRGAVHAQQSSQGPVIGRIRPGIKVLTKAARKVQGLDKIYAEGWRVGASFDTIEKMLKEVKGCPTYPLVPRNTPWFRVCREDFADPFDADRIMELYGEKREGDKVPHLYEFPILFRSNSLDEVFPETFECWSGRELQRWSEMDPHSGEIMCMKRQDASEFAQRGRKKHWGGREKEIIEPCHPNTCDLFLANKCQHHATLRFSIPGISGIGAIELTFTSIYAKLAIPSELEAVMRAHGTITGTFNNEAIFRVLKKHQNVSRVDWENGKAGRSDQYIIHCLAKNIDLMTLARQQEARARTTAIKAGDLPAPEADPRGRPSQVDDVVDLHDDNPPPIPAEDDTPPLDGDVIDGEVVTNDQQEEHQSAEEREGTQEPGEPAAATEEGVKQPAEEVSSEAEEEEAAPPPRKRATKKKAATRKAAGPDKVLVARMEDARDDLGWSDEDIAEYVEGNFGGKPLDEVILDKGALQGIVDDLEGMLARRKQKQEESEEGAGQADDAPPPGDDDCPF